MKINYQRNYFVYRKNNIHHAIELKRVVSRFKKVRTYTTYGHMNILPMEYVCKKPHKYSQIQLNTDTHFNAIIMDIDDEEMLTEWNAVGLLVPTIQTTNLHNKKAHLVWLLNVPVSKRNKKAVRYYRDIVKSIQILIGADRNYQNHQTKNFLNTHLYHTVYNDYAYDLSEFRQFILPTSSVITYTAIAKLTQVSLSTIKRYAGLIRKFIAKKNGLIRSIRVIASRDAKRATPLPLRGINECFEHGGKTAFQLQPPIINNHIN